MVAPPETPPIGLARWGQDSGEVSILRGVIAARSQGMRNPVSSSIGPGQSEGPGPDEEDVMVRTRPERRREAGPRGEERPFPDLQGALYGKSVQPASAESMAKVLFLDGQQEKESRAAVGGG